MITKAQEEYKRRRKAIIKMYSEIFLFLLQCGLNMMEIDFLVKYFICFSNYLFFLLNHFRNELPKILISFAHFPSK